MNYLDLLRVTLPETVLEVTALIVLIFDLGVVRGRSLRMRVAAAGVLGMIGCGVALMTIPLQAQGGLKFPGSDQLVLSAGGSTAVAQVGILALTVLTLLLMFDTTFTRNVASLSRLR